MANQSTFPTTLDGTPTDRTSGDSVPSEDWNQYMDAIDQLETKVGVNSSAVATSIDYLIKTLPPAGSKSRVVQVVNVMYSTVLTGTTITPFDNTVPTNAEGIQMMSASITPTNANNKLLIEVTAFVSQDNANARAVTLALHQDTSAAIAAVAQSETQYFVAPMRLTYYMVAGTTSATIFKVRIGAHDTATITLNGQAGGQIYGGVAASSITITEIAV